MPQRAQLFLDCAVFLQRGKSCEWWLVGSAAVFAREGDPLARIAVNSRLRTRSRSARSTALPIDRLHLVAGRGGVDVNFGGLLIGSRGGAKVTSIASLTPFTTGSSVAAQVCRTVPLTSPLACGDRARGGSIEACDEALDRVDAAGLASATRLPRLLPARHTGSPRQSHRAGSWRSRALRLCRTRSSPRRRRHRLRKLTAPSSRDLDRLRLEVIHRRRIGGEPYPRNVRLRRPRHRRSNRDAASATLLCWASAA